MSLIWHCNFFSLPHFVWEITHTVLSLILRTPLSCCRYFSFPLTSFGTRGQGRGKYGRERRQPLSLKGNETEKMFCNQSSQYLPIVWYPLADNLRSVPRQDLYLYIYIYGVVLFHLISSHLILFRIPPCYLLQYPPERQAVTS